MSNFHPDEATLMNFAAGSLSLPQALAIRVHLGFCLQCRNHCRQLTQVGASLLEKITPASLADDGFEQLFERIEQEDSQQAHQEAPVKNYRETQNLAATSQDLLLKYLPSSLENLPWKKQTSTIAKFDLSSMINVAGFQVALQKISAGARVPTHTHKGFEYTVILSGGFSDELGVYHQGDFIARDASHRHSPTALQNEDCICLTVLNAPLKFTGWQRIFNPFMLWH